MRHLADGPRAYDKIEGIWNSIRPVDEELIQGLLDRKIHKPWIDFAHHEQNET